MKATVIISNYNYGKYVGHAIESCLGQTVPCDVIVIDDASTDDSWDVISSYVDDVKAVRLKVNSEGNARGKNIGICLATTDLITCLDADDMLLPKSIEHRLLFKDGIDFVHGWSHTVETEEGCKKIRVNPKKCQLNDKRKKLAKEDPERWTWAIEASTVLARKSIYDKFGLYDEDMRWKIDREMWWRWLSHGAKKHTVMEYVSIYRRHNTQVTGDRSRKNPKQCTEMLVERKSSRKVVTAENTLLIPDYDYESHIEEIK